MWSGGVEVYIILKFQPFATSIFKTKKNKY